MSAAATNFDSVMSKLGVTKPAASSTTSTTDATSLDQSAFLKLMTAQLQNQDPFEPVDNAQMVSQMAQMSSVTGIAQMGTTLDRIATNLSTPGTAEAISYVGKTVLVDGKVAYPAEDGSLVARAVLPDDATDLTVTITDADGNFVKTLPLGAQAAGEIEFAWDGTDESGADATASPFTLSAIARTDSGSTAVTTQVWAPVLSVTLSSDGTAPALQLGGLGSTALSAVHQVA